MTTTLSLLFGLVLLSAVMASTKIDSSLLETLNSGKTARLRVSMTACPEEVKPNKDESFDEHTQELAAYAARCQATVLRLLEAEKSRLSAVTWESLWPDQTIVNGADLKLANDIAALENVAKIEAKFPVQYYNQVVGPVYDEIESIDVEESPVLEFGRRQGMRRSSECCTINVQCAVTYEKLSICSTKGATSRWFELMDLLSVERQLNVNRFSK